MIQLLALSGSLRGASTNTALLRAAARLAPAGTSIDVDESLGDLPLFNPDRLEPLPDAVARLQARVDRADGLLIACPEYARGIPGAFKNALDWLVGSTTFPGKPVALFNASSRATDAQAALRLVLQTMSANIIDAACLTVPLLGQVIAPAAIVADPLMAEPIALALADFAATIATLRSTA